MVPLAQTQPLMGPERGALVAHPGHIVDVAGHDHVLAGILIGIAVLGGLLAGLKGGKEADEDASEEEAPA